VAHNCLLLAIVGTQCPTQRNPAPLFPWDAKLLMHLHLPSSRKETFAGSAAADAPAHWDAPDGTRVVQANHSILSDFHTPVNAHDVCVFGGVGAGFFS
jgi:hypothetical protein